MDCAPPRVARPRAFPSGVVIAKVTARKGLRARLPCVCGQGSGMRAWAETGRTLGVALVRQTGYADAEREALEQLVEDDRDDE